MEPNRKLHEKPKTVSALTAGALTGYILWAITFPIDTMKTRIQSDSLKEPYFKNMFHCF